MLEREEAIACRKKGITSAVVKTKCGRVSKPPVNQTAKIFVIGWAAIENCRLSKRSKLVPSELY